jgi:hypothetical protein
MRSRAYRCPVCRKQLTQQEYERALGSLGEREKHLQHELREAKQRERSARKDGAEAERARTRRLLSGKDKQISALNQRIKQLQKGTTPQTEGLEFEDKLTVRLQREFPSDQIEHKGQAGDVLHIVRFDGKVAGTIIYECKRTPRIERDHVRQAYLAQQLREAHFAVLVTTGTKRGFSGFAQSEGVFVVSLLICT